MKIALTGASGIVGRFILRAALRAGHQVTALGRGSVDDGGVTFRAFDLASPESTPLYPDELLIHAAFAHLPGRYRGGEGDDPAGFKALNLEGSARLFRHARDSGVGRVVFLSSRAVYDGMMGRLTEDLPLAPDTLYGQVKLAAEDVLAGLSGPGFAGVSIRATGVYGRSGPGDAHKWQDLFADFAAGRAIAARAGSEVHGDDLAAAVLALLSAPADQVAGFAFNASDIVLDRHDLLAEVAHLTGNKHPPPARDTRPVAEMDCARLRALGWMPGGMERLRDCLPTLVAR